VKVDLFDFELPPERIALRPAVPRDAARLLVLDGEATRDCIVSDLPAQLRAGDCLVFNDTRVIPAQLHGRRGDAVIGATLHKREGPRRWRAFIHAAKRLREGVATEDEHAIVWTMVLIAQGIERSSVIRGLAEHLLAARSALDAVAARALSSGAWHAVPLEFCEIDVITDAIEFHQVQLQVVSRRELHEIAARLINQRVAAGDQVRRITLQEALS